jgi:hypothetical protein
MPMQWHGNEVIDFVKEAAWEGIQRATEFLHAALQRELNVSNPRPYKTPSQPGEPPCKRTGFGQRNVLRQYDKENMTARVGVASNAIYMLFLEVGTRFIRPRPWLWATVVKVFPQMQILAGGK